MVLGLPRSRDVDSGPRGPITSGVGWQDRDWAKLGDDELDALYGTGVPSRRFSVRQVVWSAVALLVVAGGAFAVTHRETGQPPAPLQLTPAPTVIYGEPIMFEGTVAARTEFTQQPTGAMQCTTIDPKPQSRAHRTRGSL